MGILFLFIHHALQIYEITGICILTILSEYFSESFFRCSKPKTLEKFFFSDNKQHKNSLFIWKTFFFRFFGKGMDTTTRYRVFRCGTRSSFTTKGSISLSSPVFRVPHALGNTCCAFLAFDAEQHLSIIFTGLAMGLLF